MLQYKLRNIAVFRFAASLSLVLFLGGCDGEIGPEGPIGERGGIGQEGPIGERGARGESTVWVDADGVEVGRVQAFPILQVTSEGGGIDAEIIISGDVAPVEGTVGQVTSDEDLLRSVFWVNRIVHVDGQGVRWPVDPFTGLIEENELNLTTYYDQSDCSESSKSYAGFVGAGFAFQLTVNSALGMERNWYVLLDNPAPLDVDIKSVSRREGGCFGGGEVLPLVSLDSLQLVAPPDVTFRLPLRSHVTEM